MALANNALTTVATVKNFLGIIDSELDDNIEFLINSSSQTIENICSRKFAKQQYVEKYRANDSQILQLNNFPIITINSLKVNDGEISDYALTDSDKLKGCIVYDNSIFISKWIVSSVLTTDRYRKMRNIEVDYEAGYVLPKDDLNPDPRTLPYDLETLCIQMIKDYMQSFSMSSSTSDVSDSSLTNFKISDVSWTFGGVSTQQLYDIAMNYEKDLQLKGYKRSFV